MVEVITWEGDDRIEVGPARDPLRLWEEGGDDFIASENPTAGREEFRLPYDEIDGGPGDDTLLGGPGSDVISGGKVGGYGCDNPATCGGRDTIDGRDGDDVVQDSDSVNGTPIDRDVLNGGAGRDELDYSPRHIGAVEVSLDPRYANPAEDADVVSGFEDLTGTSGSDHLIGDGAGNTLRGRFGPDVLLGRAGDDVVSGGSDFDLVEGGRGRDSLGGGLGDDLLRGGLGNDILRGGDGRDRLRAHGGADLIRAAADGRPDRIYCGDGQDTVSADSTDQLSGCERVTRRDF
jgi:Ca2+-binding RTX toxin-like protein